VKKFILITILIISGFLTGAESVAQPFKAAIMGGFNISQVDGDYAIGYNRFGGHLGVAVILPINNFDITLETVFNQKGSYRKKQYDSDSLTCEYDLRLNYVEIPLMVHYTDKDFITAGLGFSFGRLVQATEVEHSGNRAPYTDSVEFNKNDYNFLADVQIRVWKRLKFNVRFAYSIVPIRERTYYTYCDGRPLPATAIFSVLRYTSLKYPPSGCFCRLRCSIQNSADSLSLIISGPGCNFFVENINQSKSP